MEQTKIADLSQQPAEEQDSRENAVRTLSELELALAGGGDGHINW